MNIKEMFKEVLPLISKYSPTISAAIGGPYGFAIGYLIPILAKTFNCDPQNIAGLVKNIINDPDAQSKLESIEHDHCDWLCSIMDNVDRLSNAEINIKLSWSPK